MLPPEILAEQVMGYVVGASEMIPTLKPSKNPYSVAILPQGPHFYTGLLQAAGYLLLDEQKKKLLIISQQQDDEINILIDNTNYGPVFGQKREYSEKTLASIAKTINAKITTPDQQSLLDEQIRFQLPFLRVITDTEEILHISIGEKITSSLLKKCITWIQKNIQNYNIVLLTNIELSPSTTSQKSDEHKQIAKLIETPPTKMILLTLFQKILASQKRHPEVVAYVNPSDFAKKTNMTTRYICAVG